LDLQPPRKVIRDARKLTQPNYLSIWDVPNVHSPEEREHVMLAHREDLYPMDYDHFLMRFVEQGTVDESLHGLACATR
jgi:hypothetical protein